jgi:hypothetical protein
MDMTFADHFLIGTVHVPAGVSELWHSEENRPGLSLAVCFNVIHRYH